MTVYSERQVKRFKPPTPQQLKAIADILKKHKGRANAIHSKKIARKVGIAEHDSAANIRIRAAITEAMFFYALPVGACGAGYFLIANETELNDYLARLSLRAQSIMKRAKAVRRNYWHSSEQATLQEATA